MPATGMRRATGHRVRSAFFRSIGVGGGCAGSCRSSKPGARLSFTPSFSLLQPSAPRLQLLSLAAAALCWTTPGYQVSRHALQETPNPGTKCSDKGAERPTQSLSRPRSSALASCCRIKNSLPHQATAANGAPAAGPPRPGSWPGPVLVTAANLVGLTAAVAVVAASTVPAVATRPQGRG